MKKGTLTLVFFISLIYPTLTSNNLFGNEPGENLFISSYGIEDGWYRSTVKVTSPTDFYGTKYKLDVKVKYNKVVTIDFGNGGSIHTGYNNSNYIYSGGTLSFETDFYGKITAATGKVTIIQNGTYKYYNVRIE